MELEGGLFFVQGFNRREEYGSLYKQISSGGEDGITSKFFPNKWLRTTEHIPNHAIDFQKIASAIHTHAKHNRAILVGVPHVEQKLWQKTKKNCLDLPSVVLPLDIEKKWHEVALPEGATIENTPLRTIVEAELKTIFPKHPNLGYVARYSATARIKRENPQLRIRIYVLLDKPVAYVERVQRFAGLETDDAVFEYNCLDLIQPALVMDRGVDTYDIPYEEIIWEEGERLPIDDFEKKHTRTAEERHQQKGTDGRIVGKGSYRMLINLWHQRNNISKKKDPKDYNKRRLEVNSERYFDAFLQMAKEGLLDGRRFSVHWILMLNDFRKNGNCYASMAFIGNNPEVLGKDRTWQTLLNNEAKIRKYFHQKWNGTGIREMFKEKEILSLDSLDTQENYKSIESFFEGKIDPFDDSAGYVVVDSQPIGLGKTSTTLPYFCKIYEDDAISICYRRSILLMQCKMLGFSYYLEIPDWYRRDNPDTDFSTWTEFNIKAKFLSELANPATTIQSLHFLKDQYGKIEGYKELLIVDEPERVLNELWIKPELAEGEKKAQLLNDQFQIFMELAHKAHTVVLADADASTELTGWLVECCSRAGKKKYLIENKQDWYRAKQFCRFDSREEWLVALKKMHDAGEDILVHTDLGDDLQEFTDLQETIRDYLDLQDWEIVGYHAGSDFTEQDIREDMNPVIQKDRERGVRVCLLSPIIQIGASHTGVPFDRIMLYFHHGKAFGTDRFQTGLRDRKATWIGYYFAGAYDPSADDEVSYTYEEEGIYQPSFTSPDRAELQKNLALRNKNARENPAAAFECLLEEREAPRVDFHYPITHLDRYQAGACFTEHTQAGRQVALNKLRQKEGLLKEFAQAFSEDHHHSTRNWQNLKLLDGLEEFTDEEIKKAHQYLKKGDGELAKRMLDLWLMDKEERSRTAKEERAAFQILQGDLLDKTARLWSIHFDTLHAFLRYSQQEREEEGFEFHIEGTEESKDFNTWVRQNSRNLDVGALMELRGWQESPHKIAMRAFDILGWDAEVLEKKGGRIDGKNIASVILKDLYKEYRKTNQIQPIKKSGAAKIAMLALIYEKKKEGIALTKLEEDFFATIGRRLRVKPRRLVPIAPWVHIASKTGNPHYSQWYEEKTPSGG